jgi:hypothetical protein
LQPSTPITVETSRLISISALPLVNAINEKSTKMVKEPIKILEEPERKEQSPEKEKPTTEKQKEMTYNLLVSKKNILH